MDSKELKRAYSIKMNSREIEYFYKKGLKVLEGVTNGKNDKTGNGTEDCSFRKR